MKLPVLTAAGGAGWEATWLVALETGDHGVVVVRRCVDVVELLAVAATGQARAVLVDAGLRRLDADVVDRLRHAGVVPVAVVPRDEPSTDERLRALGIDHLVPADAEPAVVATVVSDAVQRTVEEPAHAFGDPAAATSTVIAPTGDPVAAQPPRRGAVLAVWGPTGAPGRTTVAVTLADELARLGCSTLLVDADVYGGVVAAVLGLLDESPGLAAACRHASAKRLEPEVLGGLAWQVTPQLRVLTGIPRADRWPELRPAAIPAVLTAARGLADFTVVDCGFNLEADEELSFDSLAPRRNGATLEILDQADVVVAVGAADPIGMQRLVRGLSQLADAEVTAPIWAVLNKVRTGVVPGDPAAELTAALQRFAGRAPAALLPEDAGALDAALAAGQTLAETRPRSALRQATAELAAALAGMSSSAGRAPRRPGTIGAGRRRLPGRRRAEHSG
jgi:MinD-like ATPase involved in chromosome partitioning or flagellar assembly